MKNKIIVMLLALCMIKPLSAGSYAEKVGAATADALMPWAVATAIVSYGLMTLSFIDSTKKYNNKNTAQYMKANHPALVHAISTGNGPIINDWAHDLSMSPEDLNHFKRRLTGSQEQLELLDSLKDEITEEDADKFANNLAVLFLDTLKPDHLVSVVMLDFSK